MITITLKPEEWNAVLGCLAEAPFKLAAPLIQAIQQQAGRQMSAPSDDSLGEQVGHDYRANGVDRSGHSP
jgi:hypothetical protein